MQYRLSRIEALAHRIDALLPGVIVKDEIAETRMSFEDQPEQVLDFAFVPVSGMHLSAYTRYPIFGTGQMSKHVHPTGFASAI